MSTKHIKALIKAETLVNQAILCMIDADDAFFNEDRLEETEEFLVTLSHRVAKLHEGLRSVTGHCEHKIVQASLFGPDSPAESKSA